jgi:hypothetical protein
MAGEVGTFIAYERGRIIHAYSDLLSAALLRFGVDGVRGLGKPRWVTGERALELCPGLVRLRHARNVPGSEMPDVPAFSLDERVRLAEMMARQIERTGQPCGDYDPVGIERELQAATAALRASEAKRHKRRKEEFGEGGMSAAAMASGSMIAWCLATGQRVGDFCVG